MKQQSLFDKTTTRRYKRTEHGGSLSIGKRKLERPFAKGHWLHLVLKSDKAIGRLSLFAPKNKIFVEALIRRKANQFGVDLGDYVNGGDHLHIKVRATSRVLFQKFLKSITGTIARFVTGARRGKRFGRFWLNLAYTRVLRSRTEEIRLRHYFSANLSEALFGRKKREEFLSDIHEWMRKPSPRMQTFEEMVAFESS